MASTSGLFISRRPKKPSKLPLDARHEIAERLASGLRQFTISVIGDESTGRRTLIRRFLNMNGGPFQRPESRGDGKRDIFVDLKDRPYLFLRGTVCLHTSILNLQELDFEAILETVANLDSFVVIFDVGRSITFLTAIHCMVKITELLRHNAPEFILVGNKIDLPQREVLEDRGREVAETCGAEHYYECSALMNVNMDAVLDATLITALDLSMVLPS
ncbi:hypothetical protein AVEN_24928-1 [Araneus ventricosus]|uniref:small monomeric GTPase n=1 Tax=Araneus ventricosus TaxID=182803 RepID=A0A4Y2S4J6_ARAVE|nr:hypothetical protein AVEN_24928-1 [Araneus ventricosus]